ncbi:MAG: cold shock domain-containing protein [Thermoguttaceae bacterium]|nr:cold shock domain-containing protein [Thermoguttaceae bacterium]MDW8039466.1 cold shock domain-containing protein [Thermoguttaceae bacterium]
MVKIMVFIDGTWLYRNLPLLGQAYGKPDYRLDFGRLPQVLAQQIAHNLGGVGVDVVRTYLFGSFPVNCHSQDEDAVDAQCDFYARLKEEYHYELELFGVDFKGRRLRREDRNPGDPFEPKEKCVDVALATAMLYFAAIPYAYDIAIAVIGDLDYKPVLQHVRRLGKRVAIASIQNSCPPAFADPRDEARVKDFDIIWLNNHLAELELKYEPHQLLCESPLHQGDRKVWTTFYPRKGQKFYCDACRAKHAAQKHEAQKQLLLDTQDESPTMEDLSSLSEVTLIGQIKRKIDEKGYGFIAGMDGSDYFFHFSDLASNLSFQELQPGERVRFQVKKLPKGEKAGMARSVARVSEPSASPEPKNS